MYGFLPCSTMLDSIRAEALNYRVHSIYKKLEMHPIGTARLHLSIAPSGLFCAERALALPACVKAIKSCLKCALFEEM